MCREFKRDGVDKFTHTERRVGLARPRCNLFEDRVRCRSIWRPIERCCACALDKNLRERNPIRKRRWLKFHSASQHAFRVFKPTARTTGVHENATCLIVSFVDREHALCFALRFREHAAADIRLQSQARASRLICAVFPRTIDGVNHHRDMRTAFHRNMHARCRKREQYFNVIGFTTQEHAEFSQREVPLTSLKGRKTGHTRGFFLLRSTPHSRRSSAADDRNDNDGSDRKPRPSSTLARVSAARNLRVSTSICCHVEQLLTHINSYSHQCETTRKYPLRHVRDERETFASLHASRVRSCVAT
jgi:hypothetical protein